MESEILKEFYKYMTEQKLLTVGMGDGQRIIDGFFEAKHSWKAELLGRLSELPIKIMQKDFELLKSKNDINELKMILEGVENSTYQVVSGEEIEGKKVFSNEDKRRAETDRRLVKDTTYQEQKLRLSSMQKSFDEESIKGSFLNNNFKAARSMCLLLGVE